jgi:hypothetical protein
MEKSFPPEKTIYISLLRENGMHKKDKMGYIVSKPDHNSSFNNIWQECDAFLEESKNGKLEVQKLFDKLSRRPYKMKLGLVELFVPIFLFIKREDFALYGQNGEYIPELSDSILLLMLRNPEQYSVKAFEVEGVKLDLFNKYRELLQLDKTPKASSKGFIESIKPFLIFYRQLPPYTQGTGNLTKEALLLREAILKSEDPERTFFENFPKAFDYTIKELLQSEKTLKEYISKLRDAIKEIRFAYSELVNRLESFIQNEIVGDDSAFPSYQMMLVDRTNGIKDHMLLDHHRTFLFRLDTKTDDKQIWINSIAHALLKKPLDQFTDKDELLFYEKFSRIILELDNLSELSRVKKGNNDELIKIELTLDDGNYTTQVVKIPKTKGEKIKKLQKKIKSQLGKEKSLNIAILTMLLKEQLGND